MNEVKPIKRSVQLQPLSREHHDGLLFVWKIKQGLENRTSSEKLKDYTGWYWRNHIKPHFFQEEKVLLPFIPEGHPMAVQLKKEHRQGNKIGELNELSNMVEAIAEYTEILGFQLSDIIRMYGYNKQNNKNDKR